MLYKLAKKSKKSNLLECLVFYNDVFEPNLRYVCYLFLHFNTELSL